MVETVSVALPLVGTVTVREPVVAPYSPSWLTVTLTVRSASGAGLALTVKDAVPPSVTPLPAVTLTSGPAASSLSRTLTEAEPLPAETV